MSKTSATAWLAMIVLLAGCSIDSSTTPSTTSASSPSSDSTSSVTEPSGSTTETNETQGTAPSTSPPTTPAAASVRSVELPATPAGEQLRWILEEAADADEAEYIERFSETFLRQIPVETIRAQATAAGIEAVTEVLASSDAELAVMVSSAQGPLVVTIQVEPEAPHRIIGLEAQPGELPDAPTTWGEVDSRLAEQAANWSYLAAEVADDGSLKVLHQGGDDAPVPLGSSFKLYVLGAVVDAIEQGELAWDDELVITDELKSLPSGELQDLPAGSTVTVREAAEKMIQISDNTATDLLIDRVGRERVEAMLAPMGMGEASRAKTLPFITTRELFTLKWGLAADQTTEYSTADVEQRRTILDGLSAPLPTAADFTPEPRFIDSIEWFATPVEILAAHVWLDAYRDRPGFEPLASVLGDNPGVPLDPAMWSETAFKGGSEPGVLFLGWLLQDVDGRRVGIVVSASDPSSTLDELEVVSVSTGVIALVAP